MRACYTYRCCRDLQRNGFWSWRCDSNWNLDLDIFSSQRPLTLLLLEQKPGLHQFLNYCHKICRTWSGCRTRFLVSKHYNPKMLSLQRVGTHTRFEDLIMYWVFLRSRHIYSFISCIRSLIYFLCKMTTVKCQAICQNLFSINTQKKPFLDCIRLLISWL